MEISAPLTLFGLIATILSLGFAGAAFLNSRRRQRHMTTETAGFKPRQMPPVPSIKQAAEAALRQQAGEQSPAEPETVLFKQVDPSGKTVKIKLVDDNEYTWE